VIGPTTRKPDNSQEDFPGSALPDDAGRKTYLKGTHRVVDPAAALARVLPLAPRLGVTRLGVLTGLDGLGIPVAAAYRPNSRSIAVHQGKGGTLAAAKVSALMEALECWHAESAALPLRLASWQEIGRHGRATDPRRLPRTGRGAAEMERLLWVEATDLVSGAPVWVPYELVSADFTLPLPAGFGLFQATTNGLGAGSHWLEAVLHGLYEVVERDAVALWHALPADGQAARAVDPASVDGPASAALLACFAAARVAVGIWNVTTEIGLPAFLALAAAPAGADGVEPELGSGCHADRDVALARALAEAAQARLTRISGARDDFIPESYAPAARARRQSTADRWLGTPPRQDFRAVPCCSGATLRHDLDVALDRLVRAGFDQVAVVDLTRPEIGVPVARVVIPGLEGPWAPDGEYVPGKRAAGAD
jgi:ribosomal protein S12 methylthiotransferase accessory factor